MKITQPVSPHQNDVKSSLQINTGNTSYKIGQLLEATVLNNSLNGLVTLRLGHNDVTATTNIPLHQNTRLSLKVLQTQPQLLLQIIATDKAQPLQEAMVKMLPVQSGLAQLFSLLINKTSVKSSNTPPVPNEALLTPTNNPIIKPLSTPALLSLIAAIAERSDLKKADSLQRVISRSGLFLEGRLAEALNNTTSASATAIQKHLTSDLKALLLNYLASVKPFRDDATRQVSRNDSRTAPMTSATVDTEIAPPLKGRQPVAQSRAAFSDVLSNADAQEVNATVLKNLTGALARMNLLQVATVDNFNDGNQMWHLEIPVRHGDSIEMVSLNLKKESRSRTKDEAAADVWIVELSLDLPNLGAIESRISINELGISTTFRSNSRQTLSVIERKLDTLQQNLEQHGLHSHNLCTLEGLQCDDKVPQLDNPVIDFKV